MNSTPWHTGGGGEAIRVRVVAGQRAQRVQLTSGDRLNRLGQIIGIDALINAAQLALSSHALQPSRLRFVFASNHERHLS